MIYDASFSPSKLQQTVLNMCVPDRGGRVTDNKKPRRFDNRNVRNEPPVKPEVKPASDMLPSDQMSKSKKRSMVVTNINAKPSTLDDVSFPALGSQPAQPVTAPVIDTDTQPVHSDRRKRTEKVTGKWQNTASPSPASGATFTTWSPVNAPASAPVNAPVVDNSITRVVGGSAEPMIVEQQSQRRVLRDRQRK